MGTVVHLLCQERHWGALVQQPELSVGVLLVSGVPINAPIAQCAVEVSNQGSNVPAGHSDSEFSSKKM